MRPNTNKPKTGRRFRGLEVAQAALLLVLGVVVALAMYFVMMNMLMMAPVPDVELDPYNSFVHVSPDKLYAFANIQLVFGRVGYLLRVDIVRSDSPDTAVGSCFDANVVGYKLAVAPGVRHTFSCRLDAGTTPNLMIKVIFYDGKIVYIRWVLT
jgi:hypothetical protein